MNVFRIEVEPQPKILVRNRLQKLNATSNVTVTKTTPQGFFYYLDVTTSMSENQLIDWFKRNPIVYQHVLSIEKVLPAGNTTTSLTGEQP